MSVDKEKWLEEKLGIITKIERAKAPEGTFTKIRQKISKQNDEHSKPRFEWVAVAAVILLAVSSNAIVVSNYFSISEVFEPPKKDPYVISEFSLYENE